MTREIMVDDYSRQNASATGEQNAGSVKRKRDRLGRFVNEAGKSPEYMVKLLCDSEFKDKPFTLEQYRSLWEVRNGSALAQSTAYDDLHGAIEKKCVEAAETHQYRLTAQGRAAGEKMLELDQFNPPQSSSVRLVTVKNEKGIHAHPSIRISNIAQQLENCILHLSVVVSSLTKQDSSPMSQALRVAALKIENDEPIMICIESRNVIDDGILESVLDLLEELFSDTAALEGGETDKYIDGIRKLEQDFEASKSARDPPTSPPTPPKKQLQNRPASPDNPDPSKTGGIDFTFFPAARQTMAGLELRDVPLEQFDRIDLDKEQQEIERLVSAGIMPSSQRVKEYALAALSRGGRNKNKVTSCVMDILRLQEEYCCGTEPVFKDILVAIES